MDPETLMALMSLFSTLQTNRTNRALASEQMQWSESMQDKQNAYNTPGAQVQRLREAGISPSSLSMGNGMQVSGNTSAPVTAYERANVLDPMQIASNSFLSLMQGLKSNAERKTEDTLRDVREEEIRNSAEKYKAEIALLGLDARGQEIANEYAGLMNEVAVMKSLSEIGVNEEQAKNLASLTENNVYTLKNVLPQELQLMVDKHELNVLDQQETIAAIQSIYQNIEESEAREDLYREQSYSEIEKQELMKTEESLNQVQEGLVGSQKKDLDYHIKMYLDTWDSTASKIASEAKLSNRQVKAFWINTVLHGTANLGTAAGGAGIAIKAAAAL